jgi:hypothetical protein
MLAVGNFEVALFGDKRVYVETNAGRGELNDVG